jgi:nicotinate (nicotinamide) nucleotide adenylyltransferase
MSRRIGIYAGSFDPVHTGHIAFALQALKEQNLDRLYFLPERRPVNKIGQVEHFGHRVAMLKAAIKPHPNFKILELVDINFTVERTLPKLQMLFKKDQLVFLFGSDKLESIPNWSKSSRLLKSSELIIGLRDELTKKQAINIIKDWPVQPKALKIFGSYAPKVSSHKVRQALRSNKRVAGILRSVERYSDRNWLYISLSVVDKT